MKKTGIVLSIAGLLFFALSIRAQSFVFGPKLGMAINTQKWNGIDRGPLLSPQYAVFIESYREESPSSLYAQLGYFQRGSSQKTRFISGGGNIFDRNQSFQFNNLSLGLGARRILSMESSVKPYYILAVRFEYTLNTNLEQYEIYNGYFPIKPFVNNFNYGFTVGGGFQYTISQFVGAVLEFSVSPDISKQYDQYPIPNVVDPFRPGMTVTLGEQHIRNLAFEITLGLRLLRKVEYID